jgi:hypothetical protein
VGLGVLFLACPFVRRELSFEMGDWEDGRDKIGSNNISTVYREGEYKTKERTSGLRPET